MLAAPRRRDRRAALRGRRRAGARPGRAVRRAVRADDRARSTRSWPRGADGARGASASCGPLGTARRDARGDSRTVRSSARALSSSCSRALAIARPRRSTPTSVLRGSSSHLGALGADGGARGAARAGARRATHGAWRTRVAADPARAPRPGAAERLQIVRADRDGRARPRTRRRRDARGPRLRDARCARAAAACASRGRATTSRSAASAAAILALALGARLLGIAALRRVPVDPLSTAGPESGCSRRRSSSSRSLAVRRPPGDRAMSVLRFERRHLPLPARHGPRAARRRRCASRRASSSSLPGCRRRASRRSCAPRAGSRRTSTAASSPAASSRAGSTPARPRPAQISARRRHAVSRPGDAGRALDGARRAGAAAGEPRPQRRRGGARRSRRRRSRSASASCSSARRTSCRAASCSASRSERRSPAGRGSSSSTSRRRSSTRSPATSSSGCCAASTRSGERRSCSSSTGSSAASAPPIACVALPIPASSPATPRPRGFLEWAAERAPALATPGARLFARAGLRPPPSGVKEARATLRAHGLLAEDDAAGARAARGRAEGSGGSTPSGGAEERGGSAAPGGAEERGGSAAPGGGSAVAARRPAARRAWRRAGQASPRTLRRGAAGPAPALAFRGVWFERSGGRAVLRGVDLGARSRRAGRAHGPQRGRQVDPAAPRQRAARADAREGRASRARRAAAAEPQRLLPRRSGRRGGRRRGARGWPG